MVFHDNVIKGVVLVYRAVLNNVSLVHWFESFRPQKMDAVVTLNVNEIKGTGLWVQESYTKWQAANISDRYHK